MDEFLQGLIEEHRKNDGSQSQNTMIDHLLSLQESQPEYYTDQIIKGLVLVSSIYYFIFLPIVSSIVNIYIQYSSGFCSFFMYNSK